MPSRLLIGATGWLLGAVTATAGSLYAVDQLGQGLLAQHSKRVSVTMVNKELAQENSERPAQASGLGFPPSPTPSTSGSRAARARGTASGRWPHWHRSPGPSQVVDTPGGQAEAACKRGAAYLIYESPGQGYDIHALRRGPARVASVTFTNASGGVVLRVSCSSSGQPLKHVSTFSWGAGAHHED